MSLQEEGSLLQKLVPLEKFSVFLTRLKTFLLEAFAFFFMPFPVFDLALARAISDGLALGAITKGVDAICGVPRRHVGEGHCKVVIGDPTFDLGAAIGAAGAGSPGG